MFTLITNDRIKLTVLLLLFPLLLHNTLLKESTTKMYVVTAFTSTGGRRIVSSFSSRKQNLVIVSKLKLLYDTHRQKIQSNRSIQSSFTRTTTTTTSIRLLENSQDGYDIRTIDARPLEIDDTETTIPITTTATVATIASASDTELSTTKVNGNNSNSAGRFDELLNNLGLSSNYNTDNSVGGDSDSSTASTGTLKHVRILSNNNKRIVSKNDIFCNRDLRLSTIKAIGFDMDYTLAQYKQPEFDLLAFNGAKNKLITSKHYPTDVLNIQYNHSIWTRGLIIDTQRGNFLKIDRHKYVRVAYHGLKRMSSTTRKFLYSRTFNKVMSFSEKHFINLDTLFQFVDAHLFASIIDMKDSGNYEELDLKTYEEIYKDIRDCVDLCHRDGVIKDEVHRNPLKYIILDNGLIPMLQNFRQQGVKTFLLTNSLWEYTSTAMNYLYHGTKLSDEEQKKNLWMELFDTIIVGSCKPAYMLDPYLNLFRVDSQTGTLRNTDGVYEITALGDNGASKFLTIGKTFQGGNWLHLQAMLQIQAGEEILYVGDHLYSDVLRSKRTLGWRSVFVMPELEDEMTVFSTNVELFHQLVALRQLRDELGKYADTICQQAMSSSITNNDDDTTTTTTNRIETILEEIQAEDTILKDKLKEITELWHVAFHPVWGAMFNAGYQDSRFAFYVSNYACLYTSRATNLGLTTSLRNFRASTDSLPHDRLLQDYTSTLG